MTPVIMSPNLYASYMLRLQLQQNGDHSVWVASLESTKTGELRWFPNIDELIQSLREEFGDYEPAQNTKPFAPLEKD
jgi:hypothetical protein